MASLLLGYLPLSPCDGTSGEGPGLLGFFLSLFSSPEYKASGGTSLPGAETQPGSDMGEAGTWGAKLWDVASTVGGG